MYVRRVDIVIRSGVACRAWEYAGGRVMLSSMLNLRERIVAEIEAMDAEELPAPSRMGMTGEAGS